LTFNVTFNVVVGWRRLPLSYLTTQNLILTHLHKE